MIRRLGWLLLLLVLVPTRADADDSIWLPYWDMPAALSTVTANADLFGTAHPFWFDSTSCSTIKNQSGAGSPSVVSALRAKGLKVVPTITASGLSPRRAVACLGNPARRAAHVRLVVAKARAYDGIDIDYESLPLTDNRRLAARVRSAYSSFVTDLCHALDRRDQQCSITVMSRASDRLQIWNGPSLPWVYDYKTLCASATTLRVMAYDQHNRLTKAGPVAGMPWVESVARYAAGVCTPNKVALGVALYGRDWSPRGMTTLTGDEGFALARKHGVTPRFDATQQEYTFSYSAGGVRHTVWMSGPRSAAARVALAHKLGLSGVSYWAAGQQPAGTWAAVRALK